MNRRSLLIDGVFSQAIAHVIEALSIASSFRKADSSLEIAILLNAAAPLEICECVADLDLTIIPINLKEFAAAPGDFLKQCRPQWDFLYIIRDEAAVRSRDSLLARFHVALKQWLNVTRVRHHYRPPGAFEFPAQKSGALNFVIPAGHQTNATKFLTVGSPRVAIVTGSAAHQRAPSPDFWRLLINALTAKYPKIEIVLIGRLGVGAGDALNITPHELSSLVAENQSVTNCFNLPINTQLAIAKKCQVLIAPQTGMGNAIQCVGVPWVILSAYKLPEYIFNQVPFIPLYPDCPLYPCTSLIIPRRGILEECRTDVANKTGTISCMRDAALRLKLPAILAAADDLLNVRLSYEECLQAHKMNLRARGVTRFNFFFENHEIAEARVN